MEKQKFQNYYNKVNWMIESDFMFDKNFLG